VICIEMTGKVVCSIDTGEYCGEYLEEAWAYLQKGVMIEWNKMGLTHDEEPEPGVVLVRRRDRSEQRRGACQKLIALGDWRRETDNETGGEMAERQPFALRIRLPNFILPQPLFGSYLWFCDLFFVARGP
jgi:hypothetical protein